MIKKYAVEFVGTLALSLAVVLSVAAAITPLPTPVLAGLTLALFVYTIGPISGCHINPAVTLGQLSLKKITWLNAAGYIIAQALGAAAAAGIARYFGIVAPGVPAQATSQLFLAELIGTAFFNFGIAAVVLGKAPQPLSGAVIGGSLVFGVLLSVMAGAAGILNPAVAIALNSLTTVYLIAPIIGAIIGVQAYKYVAGEKV